MAQLLARAIEVARAGAVPLSVGLVDIDHFKRVNDQWGHAIGDEVLRCVAGHLAAHARKAAGEGGVAGRQGGEEFLVVYPGLALAEALAAMDGARAQLARQVLRRADDGASLGRVSFSAGVAMLRDGDDADALVDRADAALYAAKRGGRDRVLPEAGKR
jgi:diguanylate cyclase